LPRLCTYSGIALINFFVFYVSRPYQRDTGRDQGNTSRLVVLIGFAGCSVTSRDVRLDMTANVSSGNKLVPTLSSSILNCPLLQMPPFAHETRPPFSYVYSVGAAL
jgi:hypothetical protein